jgi:hypothetical protein
LPKAVNLIQALTAISKREREYLSRIEYVSNLLEKDIKEEIQLLKPKQKME